MIYTGFQQELSGEPERFISVECLVKDYLRVKRIVKDALEAAEHDERSNDG